MGLRCVSQWEAKGSSASTADESLPPLSDGTSGQMGGQTEPGVGAASRERRTSQKLRCGCNTRKAGMQDGTCAAEKPGAGGL